MAEIYFIASKPKISALKIRYQEEPFVVTLRIGQTFLPLKLKLTPLLRDISYWEYGLD